VSLPEKPRTVLHREKPIRKIRDLDGGDRLRRRGGGNVLAITDRSLHQGRSQDQKSGKNSKIWNRAVHVWANVTNIKHLETLISRAFHQIRAIAERNRGICI